MDSPVTQYLRALRRELRWRPMLAERLCEEAADHLGEIVRQEREQGMSPQEAETEAVRRFGDPRSIARQFDERVWWLKPILLCGAASLLLTAAWLAYALTMVMPARNSWLIPVWTAIAVGFVVYALLTVALVFRGPRPTLVLPVVVLSFGAVAFGIFAIRAMYLATTTGGHFEGYQLLMGLLVGGTGVCALAYASLTATAARRARAH